MGGDKRVNEYPARLPAACSSGCPKCTSGSALSVRSATAAFNSPSGPFESSTGFGLNPPTTDPTTRGQASGRACASPYIAPSPVPDSVWLMTQIAYSLLRMARYQ